MFYIKKNGVLKKISGRIASLLASAIGFTPPTGMSATNVQDAIEEVNTNTAPIDITSQCTWQTGIGNNSAILYKQSKIIKVSFTIRKNDFVNDDVLVSFPQSYNTLPTQYFSSISMTGNGVPVNELGAVFLTRAGGIVGFKGDTSTNYVICDAIIKYNYGAKT